MDQPAESRATDAELVRASLAGRAPASREIVQRHGRHLFNFLCQFVRHRQDAEDLTQDTFVKAFKNLHRFDPDRSLAAWLFTIARRTALNYFRDSPRWESIPDDLAGSQPSPAHQEEKRDLIENIWARARRRLSPRDYEVLWLRFGENLSIEETARITGLTRTNIKILVFRARRQLMEGRMQS